MCADNSRDAAAYQRGFFDEKAAGWREIPRKKIDRLLSPLPVAAGDRVLDIGCGTGVLEPALLARGAAVDAIDLSPQMIARARQKEENRGANFAVADFYTFAARGGYDHALVFDAYPHFLDKPRFADRAAALLKEGGTLWIFFDAGRAEINGRHTAQNDLLSRPLRSAPREAEVFFPRFRVISMTDTAENYCIGLKKEKI